MNNLRITKKNLLSLYKQNLLEMAMDFQTPDRPERGLQNKLSTGDTDHKNVPYPEIDDPNKNFQEILASERYLQVVAKLREYVPNAPTLNANAGNTIMSPLTMTMMQAHNNIVNIERNSRAELAQLAVELVTKEMGIRDGLLQFDVQIVGMGEIDTDDFTKPIQNNQEPEQDGEDEENDQQPDDEDQEVEEDLFQNLQGLDIEKAKRRMINSLIQGASKRGHYMYNYVADRISQITGSDTLITQYGILMSINDTLYWQLSDDVMKSAMGANGGSNLVGGKESINVETTPPTIVARGVNFPILVHEIIKGIMELIAIKGRSKEMFDEVETDEDTMEKEVWDARLGPAIWDRLRAQFPEEIVIDENKVELQSYLLNEIFQLPAKKFFVFFKEIFEETERGKQLMNILMNNAYQLFNDTYNNNQLEDEDLDEAIEEATNEINDEDLMNFLTSIGIKMNNPGLFGPTASDFNPDQLN